jgi:hypothetical protein
MQLVAHVVEVVPVVGFVHEIVQAVGVGLKVVQFLEGAVPEHPDALGGAGIGPDRFDRRPHREALVIVAVDELAVAAGRQDAPARLANRGVDVRVRKAQALDGEGVHVGRQVGHLAPEATGGIAVEVIGCEEEDVQLVLFRLGPSDRWLQPRDTGSAPTEGLQKCASVHPHSPSS